MKKILVPTDFSQNAKKATDFALMLFDAQDAEITLLNTFYIPYSVPDISYSVNDLSYENAKQLFEKEKERIKESFPDLKATISTKFSIGDVVNVASSVEDDFDVIVMGTKGASGLAEVFIGSRTSAMVRSVSIPLLVVPEEAEVKLPKRILFATDETLTDPKINIDILKKIAVKNKSEIDALYMSNDDEDKTAIKAFIGSEVTVHLTDIPHQLKIQDGENVELAINEFVANNPVDLVAMITNKGNLFHNLFHKSVTKSVVMHTKMPLLVMQRKLN
tara:strand:- start:4645 stop:5469 length:825 start_codon:yes stop_codon:yes gene_type:complete